MYRKIANTFCKVLIYMIAFMVAALMGIMLIHILMESIPALREVGIKMFLPSSEWRPVSAAPQYGLLPAVTGTLYVSGLAVLFAMILGVACACFLTFFMPKKLASVCLAFIDLVAGIPSVIFGFIGLTVLVKAFVKYLKMAAGQCVLVAGIVLGIMLLPYVVSTCQESLVNAKRTYEKSGLALGVVSLKRLLNQSNLKSWSSKMIKKSLEAYFFTLKNKIVFCKKQFQNMSVFCFVSTEIV